MAAAGPGLHDGLTDLWAAPPARARAGLIATGVALLVHVAVAAALAGVDARALFERDRTVEIEVNEPKPPPPEVRPDPPPPPPPEPEPRPRIVARRAPATKVAPPPEAPPPPNQEPPPNAAEAPPVFGVTMSSVVSGDAPGMAVPVGNTLMTKERKPAKAGPVQPLAGDPNALPAPVPEVYIATQPKVLNEIKADYPEDARRMGLEAQVDARLLLDENGNVRQVKIIKTAGHGFDEAAREALRKYKFSPARTSDGKAVPTTITYRYTFTVDQ